ncbi:MAG: hypothetical protein ABS46_16030 [Cytophagaceae bacterium SCN 52-12]|nr:MAG: hypothetical protein ABS46_16030 [Cytophagaceae bacterium SCN 52-12]
MDIFKIPWPWYIAGPLIGLTVPALLLLGNKPFGISSSLRHICAACFPANLPFFSYNWRDEIWNLLFVLGILIGGYIGGVLLENPDDIVIASHTREVLSGLKINDFSGLLPLDLFSTENILSAKGLVFLVAGGFLVGFGTRYAGGCTSGHAIMGLSNLQWPSLVATICFMASGILTTFYIIPVLLKFLL